MTNYRLSSAIVLLFLAPLIAAADAPPKLQNARPETVGMSSRRLAVIDDVVDEGLERERMPGCVVMIGRQGRIVHFRAYGHKQLKPEMVPMTTDTVFDMASITKPVATATSIMLLIQQGKLSLDDKVATHIPEFAQNGKDQITIQQLLTHQGGLIPDNALKDYQDGPTKAMERVFALKPYVLPGTAFVYTDVGFIVLAELVHRVTGQNVHAFSQANIYRPLGMTETGYLPNEALAARAAPTEQRDEHWMRGEVHDSRAHLLGGIAGHAGLFSTATDLSVYAQMMLNGGQYHGRRILKSETVVRMTTGIPVSSGVRGLGWDKYTGYSSNRGDLMTNQAFGHGGFTGTVLWIDPGLDLFVIFLSNRVHPDGKGSVNRLAGRIGTIAAASILDDMQPREKSLVLTGIDVLVHDGFRQLAGRRVGLITNQTGIDRHGVSTALRLADARNVDLVALFSPEHGLEGKLDVARINDSQDKRTGIKVFSLYGKTRKPTAESLKAVDTLVFDIQDIGTRFYTFISTMGLAMQAAAEHQVRFVVLDRPNPIGGLAVEGPLLDDGRQSFVGFHTLPVRHGMTVGELARMFKAEMKLDVDLEVIKVNGWNRGEYFDATGLVWINPSPNMRSLTQAFLYPGIGLLETTNISVGRGTDTPFEVIGAPWLDGPRLAAEMNSAKLPGVRFVPIQFTPASSKFKGELCSGVNIIVTNRAIFQPVRTGLQIASHLRRVHRDDWKADALIRLLANKNAFDAVLSGCSVDEIERDNHPAMIQFLARRKQVLLYE